MARPVGHPKSGGRQKGTKNKTTIDVKELALVHGPKCMEVLADLAVNADAESVKVSACKEILDRAYGKAPQFVEHTGKDGEKLEDVSDLELARKVAFILTNATQPTHH